MKAVIQVYLFFFLSLSVSAQVLIEGKVLDENGEGLIGANIYLENTYDGTTSDALGKFSFETFEDGSQTLIISFIGYETEKRLITLENLSFITIKLKSAFNTMDAVTISAGAFEASDEKKAVILKSLDIAMTAGATADIPGALNTLPGTQKNGESGRLFVRGGTSNETKVFIDGVEAANFYGTSGPSIPTRSRFSPFLFKGTFFSTGGYGAEFGQALSSALVLKTSDVDPESRIDLSIMSVGLDASITQSWNDQSLYVKAGYTNLSPYNNLISQRINWRKGSEGIDFTSSYKRDFDDGAKLRSMLMANTNAFKLDQKTILNSVGYNSLDVKNDFLFGNLTYDKPFDSGDFLYVGFSYTYNYDNTRFNEFLSAAPVSNYHFKSKYNLVLGERTFLNAGLELFIKDYEETLSDSTSAFEVSFKQFRNVAFAELDHYLSEKWVLRGGVRAEYDNYLGSTNLSPRVSLAFKINQFEQLSIASGKYYQDPEDRFIRFSDDLQQEHADHLILNFQRIKKERVFRVEGYFKNYHDLIRFQDEFEADGYTSDGSGYAYGMDLFWRDQDGIKGLDYWISYSWLQSKRKFWNYPEKSNPGFTSAHNISIVTKKWFPRFKTQAGATYSVTSGRPYDDPLKEGFNESTTKSYHDLSYNMAWLPHKNLIIYFSASNLLGQDQVFGYHFSNEPDSSGDYLSEPIKLPAKRFLFLGCFITIGSNKNQLENL